MTINFSIDNLVVNTIDGSPPITSANLANPANGNGADMVGGVGRVVNNISALRLLSKTGVGKAFVLGYYAPGDGGGGEYSIISTGTENGGTIIVGSDGGIWGLSSQSSVNVHQFGAKGDGITNDYTAFSNALATLKTVVCLSGYTYKINSPLSVDLMKQSLNGGGSILDFSAFTGTQQALTGINSGGSPSDIVPGAVYNAIRGFKILGPGIGSTVTGIYIGAPHLVVEHCLFYNFGYGIDIFTDGYNLKFYSVNVGQCGIGLRILPGGSDYGEMISFYGCTIYDSVLGLSLGMNNGAVSMFGCHLDYCNKQFDLVSSAVVEFHGCWLENNDPGAGNVCASLTGGSKALFFGGHVVVSGTSGALTMDAYFNTDSTSYVGMTAPFLFNLQNTAQILDSGSGTIEIINSSSYDPVNYLPWQISNANSRLADGGFEGSAVLDYWAITSDTSITSRLVGTNGQLALSSALSHSGSQSLELTKIAGPCGYGVITPISRGARMGGSIWVMTSGTGVGVFVQAAAYCIEGVLPNGSPNITNAMAFDTYQTAITQGWTQYGFRQLKCPPWATHWGFAFNANGFIGVAYHDDASISTM